MLLFCISIKKVLGFIFVCIHTYRLFIKRGRKETFHMEMKPDSDSIF